MKTRIVTAIVGLILLAVVMVFYETVYFNLVFAAVCIIAIHEVFSAYGFGKKDWYIFLAFSLMALIVMLADNHIVIPMVKPAAYLFVLFLAICIIARFHSISFANLSGMVVFSAIIVFCFYSFIYLKSLLPKAQYGYDATYFVVLILAYAWGGDTCAYFAGRAFGKRKLAPVISPKKTVEGAVGGVVGSMLIGLLVTVVYMQGVGRFAGFERTKIAYYLLVVVLGLVASVLGIVGDLFASAVKRQCGIKDYGTIFPGHGGILDRFDSVLFIAPLVTIVVTAVYYRLRLG
ncbi:phosphatidate cytidylyltransferase [Ruminococcaceae bacterium OttesenSCG-928-O06]|nr:phosphatidate cytidylyltransferase [Ruminococcaceae bacterium OttesenSCG-928-O06]